jgi:hypothetical protein
MLHALRFDGLNAKYTRDVLTSFKGKIYPFSQRYPTHPCANKCCGFFLGSFTIGQAAQRASFFAAVRSIASS